jgi:hypothetical protein
MQSESRTMAKVMGASIVDAPEIQAGIQPLLRAREEETREARFTDPMSVIIDVLFVQCHDDKRRALLVKEIAEAAEVVLKGRGDPVELEPRRVGAMLDTLGVPRRRTREGFRILLDRDLERHIHQLARDYEIESVRGRTTPCALCKKMLGGISDLDRQGYEGSSGS